MIKIVKETLYEAYGAGFSQSSGFRGGMGGTSRGGFGGAWNAGGANSMYTYEIKPLNHVLEPPNRYTRKDVETIKIGSKICGYPVRSNARPDDNVKITGIVHQIVKSHNGEIMYYEVQDDATQKRVKIDPSVVDLKINPPIMSYFNDTSMRSRRREKIKAHLKEGQKVKEKLY